MPGGFLVPRRIRRRGGRDEFDESAPGRAFGFRDPCRERLDQFGLHHDQLNEFRVTLVWHLNRLSCNDCQRFARTRRRTQVDGWLQCHDAVAKGHIGHQEQILLSIFTPKECRAYHSAHHRSWEPGYGLAHGVAGFLDGTATAHRARAVAAISWRIGHSIAPRAKGSRRGAG